MQPRVHINDAARQKAYRKRRKERNVALTVTHYGKRHETNAARQKAYRNCPEFRNALRNTGHFIKEISGAQSAPGRPNHVCARTDHKPGKTARRPPVRGFRLARDNLGAQR
jgi:hypothetical protein